MLGRSVAAVIVTLLAGSTCWGQGFNTLTGDWKIVSGVLHGEVVPQSALNAMSLTLNYGNFRARSGALDSAGTVTQADPNNNQLEFAINTGSDSGRALKAIYRYENNTLTVTFSETQDFPVAFESTKDNKYLTLVYQPGTASANNAGQQSGQNDGSAFGIQ